LGVSTASELGHEHGAVVLRAQITSMVTAKTKTL
jgi:hypothetical protein